MFTIIEHHVFLFTVDWFISSTLEVVMYPGHIQLIQ